MLPPVGRAATLTFVVVTSLLRSGRRNLVRLGDRGDRIHGQLSVLIAVQHKPRFEHVEHRARELGENAQRHLAAYQIVIRDQGTTLWDRSLKVWRPAASKMLEIERGSAREEKNALVGERWLRGVNLLNVPTRLEHVRNGSELEAKQVAGFDALAE